MRYIIITKSVMSNKLVINSDISNLSTIIVHCIDRFTNIFKYMDDSSLKT